jgi:phosphate transport system permease protein
MAAVIANEFSEAADDLYLHALIEIGLLLFIITLLVNGVSRVLIWRMGRQGSGIRRGTAPVVTAAGGAA